MYAQPAKNQQSNAICKKTHQTVTNVLRTLVHTNPPQSMTQTRDIIDDALATAMHAMQTTIIGRQLCALMNIMLMRIYYVPIGSNVSLTTLRDHKF